MFLLTNMMHISPSFSKRQLLLFEESQVRDGKIYQLSLFLGFHGCPRVVFAIEEKPFPIWNLSMWTERVLWIVHNLNPAIPDGWQGSNWFKPSYRHLFQLCLLGQGLCVAIVWHWWFRVELRVELCIEWKWFAAVGEGACDLSRWQYDTLCS